MNDKYTKISVIALIFAIIALNASGTSVITGIYTFVAGTGISITGNDTNIIISSTGNFTDNMTWENTKVNKSGDFIAGNMDHGYNDINNVYTVRAVELYTTEIKSGNVGTGEYTSYFVPNPSSWDMGVYPLVPGVLPPVNLTASPQNGFKLDGGNLSLSGYNITDCGNCGGTDNLSWVTSKLNITGGNMSNGI